MSGERLSPLEWLERLVAFDTESSKSNIALIDVSIFFVLSGRK